MSEACSAASAVSTTDYLEQGFDTPSSVRAILGDEQSSSITGPECPSTTTWPTLAHSLTSEGADASEDGTGRGTPLVVQALSENQRGELLLTDIAHQLTSGGGKPGQGYSAVAFLARTCPSPDEDEGSPGSGAGSSSSSPGSSTLFDPDGFSSRTYPVSSLRTAVGTSEQSLERWPTSGTAWAGAFSTAVSSECRSDDAGCSSSEPSLTEILEEPASVPARYSLSARAAQGILRRAEKRGKTLPPHLAQALEQVASRAA